MAGIELEGDEIRPTLQLSAQEIAQLEQEKRELTGFAAAVRKSDGGRIRGEGTSLDPEPKVVNIRQRLAQQRAAAGEPVEPVATPDIEADFSGHMFDDSTPITAEADELGRLMEAAKKAGREAEDYRRLSADADREARDARTALLTYMRGHGLA